MMIRTRISFSAEEFDDGTRSARIASADRSESHDPLFLRPFVEHLRRRARDLAVGLERRLLASEPSDIVARGTPDERKKSRIVVAIADPTRATALSAVASVLARQRDAEIIFLHVQLKGGESVEQPPPAVRVALAEAEARGASAGFIVRVAPNIGRAIRRTVLEQRAGLLILGWRAPDSPPKDERPVGTEVSAVLEDPPCDVAVVGGAGIGKLSRLVVPIEEGGNSAPALKLARELAGQSGEVVELPLPVSGWSPGAPASGQSDAILRAIGDDFDAVVMAAPHESLLDRMLFGEVQAAIAERSQLPVIVAKKRSGPIRYLVRRAWRNLDDTLPDISDADRRDVMGRLGKAGADVDFLVMIGLAAAIAAFGLVVNSAAVIIGAMLVAPLLSAMVGIGLGIVAGDGAIVRRSFGAVIRGSLLALAVGYVIGLLARGQPATSEMLARGQPTLWDLGIALASGAAGAYALGREGVRASMAGVAIAAAVVPPLVAAGITFAWGLHAVSVGALLLFLTNAVAIALAGAITFLLLGFAPAPERHAQRRFLGRAMRSVAMSAVLVVIVLAGLTWRLTRLEQQDRAIRSAITNELDAYGAEVMELRHVSLGSTMTVTVTATLPETSTETLENGAAQAPPVLDREALEAIRTSLSAALDRSVRLSLTVVPVRRFEVPYP